jgi:hypothetical protein
MAGIRRPAFHDPATGLSHECNDPNFEGWLWKQSLWLKDWRKRYFILKGSKLFFAKVSVMLAARWHNQKSKSLISSCLFALLLSERILCAAWDD